MFFSFLKVLKASLVFFLICVNTIFIGVIFYLLLPFKVILKGKPELALSRIFNNVGLVWIFVNNCFLKYISKVNVKTDIPDNVTKKGWYLVVSNHQTWADIFILQQVFFNKIPFLKFFLKKELIWVPVIGLAWWALDFPFMKRFSRAYIEKNPHMKGKDLETTIKACEKFRYKPVAVMNFPEGTRNRNGKASKMKSPFEKLIRPKAGGLSFVLEAMDGKISEILDVTISYSSKSPSLGDFLSGNIDEVRVEAKIIEVEDWMVGSYANDENYKHEFQNFVNKLWDEKDKRLIELSSDFAENSNIDMKELRN